MKKYKVRIIAVCVACGLGFGLIRYVSETIDMIETQRSVIQELEEHVIEVESEVEVIEDSYSRLVTEYENVVSDLDSARQRNYELREEIDRIEEIERDFVASRGRVSNFVFTSSTDITKINIDNGDLLELGLMGNLKGLGWAFVNAGIQYGVDPLFLAAISAQESGWGRFDHGNNNIFGIMSGAMSFSSYEECIYYTAELLANYYISEGLTTPQLIQPKYCPSPTDWHYKVASCANTIINNI